MDRLKELLLRLSPAELGRAVGPDNLKQLQALIGTGASPDKGSLADYVIALHGMQLLEQKPIRRLLLNLVPREHLQELARKFAGQSFRLPYDNALALAAQPWRAGSALVEAIAKALELPQLSLPTRERSQPKVEALEPTEGLPPLYDYQSDVKNQVLEAFARGVRALLIQMPTGAGKTRTALQTIVEFVASENTLLAGRSVLWVAHTEELCEQAIDTIRTIWEHVGTHSTQIVRLWGTYNPEDEDLSGSFIVAGFQKLHSLSRKGSINALSDVVRVVIVDEAHKILAPTFQAGVLAVTARSDCVLVGLSATPGRGSSQEQNAKLSEMFDKNLIRPDLGKTRSLHFESKGFSRRSQSARCAPAWISISLGKNWTSWKRDSTFRQQCSSA